MHRFHNGSDHLLTLSFAEGINASYAYEGVAFKVFSQPGGDRQALYRCFDPATGDHFASTASNCEGFVQESVYGYVRSAASPGLVAIQRFMKPTGADHLTTATSTEGVSANWVAQSVQGYAGPGNTNVTLVPFKSSGMARIVRPLAYEIVALGRTSLTLRMESRESAQSEFPVTILNAGGATLQTSSVILPAAATSEVTLPLNSAVRAHRGDFLTLKIGSATGKFGIGFLFVAAGQSNSVASGCTKCAAGLYSADSRVVALRDPGWPDLAGVPGRIRSGEISFASHGPGISSQYVWLPLGKLLADSYNVPVGFIYIGEGNTTVSNWQSGGGFKSRFVYGESLDVTAVLWHQGESDAGAASPTSGATYESLLRGLVSETMTKVPRPWFVSQTSVCDITPRRVRRSDFPAAEIEAAQGRVIGAQLPYRVYAGPNTNLIAHACHFDFKEEFDQYIESWYRALTQSALLDQGTQIVRPHDFGQASLQDVYRRFNASTKVHTFSRSSSDFAAGTYEGPAFKLADRKTTAYPTALYFCENPSNGDHMISVDAMCEASSHRAIRFLGFSSTIRSASANADLKRCSWVYEGSPRHFASAEPEVECVPNGMTVEGSLGWVGY